MKFLFMSGQGDGLGVAIRLRHEGNDVSTWVRESRYKENLNGLLRKVKRWEDALDADTVVVYDSPGGGKTADRLRARGHFVLGASTFADSLVRDPLLVDGILQRAGISIDDQDVFGPTVEGWFDGKKFVHYFLSLETYRAMSGELGATSKYTTGTVVWLTNEEHPRAKILKRLEPILTEQDFIGPISLDGCNGITPGLRFDQFPALIPLLKLPLGSFLDAFARKTESVMTFLPNYGAAVRISIPPYPSDKWPAPDDVPIEGLTKEDRPSLYFHQVLLNDDNKLVSTGADGAILSTLGNGPTTREAFAKAYDVAKRVQVRNKQYRNDLDDHLVLEEANEAEPGTEPRQVPPDVPNPPDGVPVGVLQRDDKP